MRLNDLFEGDFILNPLPREAAAADNYLAERIQVDQWREYLNRQLGVLSLSKIADNLPMWGLYADEDRGLVIELDAENPFFKGEVRVRDRDF